MSVEMPIASAFPEPDCLHLAPGDNRFTARMRFHQSWYRHTALALPPGPNPSARGALYGNMLRPEDGRRGRNFLAESIHAAAAQRMAENRGVVEQERLRNNLLSSQPFCFNIFAPLAADLVLATDLIRTLPGVPPDAQVEKVLFEYAPPKREHLNDNSAFDAFIRYRRPGGTRGFLGIETKLTEPFSQKGYAFDARYGRWQTQPAWWWQPGTEELFPEKQHNQLWRNHLLAFSMLNQPAPEYAEGFCVVLYPEGDSVCTRAIETYRHHLEPRGSATLLAWRLEDVVGRWLEAGTGRGNIEWLKALQLRYLELDASQPAWELFASGRH